MKIVHLCLSSSFIDGYSYQENILPKYHVKLGHDVTLIASTESITSSGKTSFDAPVGIHFENGYKVIRIAYKKGFMYKIWRRLRIYSDISRLLDEEKPDIIFSHGVQFWDAFKVTDYVKKHFKVALFVIIMLIISIVQEILFLNIFAQGDLAIDFTKLMQIFCQMLWCNSYAM